MKGFNESEISGYGVKSLAKSYYETGKSLTESALYKIVGYKANNGELIRLSEKLQTIDSSEASMTSMFKKVTGKTRFTKAEFGHLGNQLTDIAERMVATVAMLIERGSLDAYVWDQKEGEHKYDITKDRQYFQEDGKTQTDAQKIALYGDNGLIDRLVQQGQMKLMPGQTNYEVDLKTIPTGYDDKLIVILLKYYTDKFVMAPLDEWATNMLSSVWLGAMFHQYRFFSFEKLWNMGLFAYNRKTEYGGGMEAVKTKDGRWINRHIRGQIEGSFQSLGRVQQAIKYMSRGDFSGWWAQQPEIGRINIARTMFKSLFVAALIFGLSLAKVPRKDHWRYTFLLSEMGMAFMTYDIMSNPLPLVGYTQTMLEAIMGDRDLTKTLMTHTPLRIGYDPYKVYDNFFGDFVEED